MGILFFLNTVHFSPCLSRNQDKDQIHISYISSTGTMTGWTDLYVKKVPNGLLKMLSRHTEFRTEVWNGDIKLEIVSIWTRVMSQKFKQKLFNDFSWILEETLNSCIFSGAVFPPPQLTPPQGWVPVQASQAWHPHTPRVRMDGQ